MVTHGWGIVSDTHSNSLELNLKEIANFELAEK
jgi:hypothetical protein